MTTRTIALTEHLSKLGLTLDGDFLRQALELLAQELIELEAAHKIGAGKYERTAARMTQRNGYRERGLDTRVGELSLRIPKVRQGSFFPSLLEPRRRAEKHRIVRRALVIAIGVRDTGELAALPGALHTCTCLQVRVCAITTLTEILSNVLVCFAAVAAKRPTHTKAGSAGETGTDRE